MLLRLFQTESRPGTALKLVLLCASENGRRLLLGLLPSTHVVRIVLFIYQNLAAPLPLPIHTHTPLLRRPGGFSLAMGHGPDSKRVSGGLLPTDNMCRAIGADSGALGRIGHINHRPALCLIHHCCPGMPRCFCVFVAWQYRLAEDSQGVEGVTRAAALHAHGAILGLSLHKDLPCLPGLEAGSWRRSDGVRQCLTLCAVLLHAQDAAQRAVTRKPFRTLGIHGPRR